jgi:hypothetical protein
VVFLWYDASGITETKLVFFYVGLNSESAKDVNTFKTIISALEWVQAHFGLNILKQLTGTHHGSERLCSTVQYANIRSVVANFSSFSRKVTFLKRTLLRVEVDALAF